MSNKKIFLIITAFTLAYALFFSILFFYFKTDRQNRLSIHYASQIEKLHAEFRATLNTYLKLENFVYDLFANDPKIRSMIKNKERLALYYKLLPYYKLLKRYDIPYLSIIDYDGSPILLMHKPLKKLTQTTLFDTPNNPLVIEFKKPIYDQGQIIANFICAINYATIQNELRRLFRNDYLFILDKDLIDKSAFRFGNFIFVQSDLSPEYYYEQEKNQFAPRLREEPSLINQRIAKKIEPLLASHTDFATTAKIDGKRYLVTFLAINKNDRHIGYLISYKEDQTIELFDTIFYQNLIVTAILLLVIFSLLAYFFYSKLQFEKLATIDKLTGVYNRHKFQEIAPKEFARAKRTNRPFSLIIFDIDHFKKINDTYGHDVGDITLSTIAKLVSQNIRNYDALFRWGGEEFVILAPETNASEAYKLAEKIRKVVENHQFPKVGKVTISLGVSQFNPNDTSIDQVIKRADMALYRSKEEGRNQVTVIAS